MIRHRRAPTPVSVVRTAVAACMAAISAVAAPSAAQARAQAPTRQPTRAHAAAPAFTLESILSAPFPSDLVASPAGGRVAWVANIEGRRDIWVAEAPSYRAVRLTRYDEDDGQELTEPAWTPDGTRLVYVRGGPPNGRGEIPNPLSEPEGVERAIWLVAADGSGASRRLAEGSEPAVSPAGDVVAFLRGGQVWTVPLAGEARAEPLFRARGRARTLRWAPDGSKLAFVSSRGDHSFTGVYDVAAGRLRWLDPSAARDRDPVWSPDGRRIAFIRMPSTPRTASFGARREGPPWSIRVAEAETGRGHEVWRAAEGRGSVFRGVATSPQLLWAGGDCAAAAGGLACEGVDAGRLVFPWERDGWTHLYSVPVDAPAGIAAARADRTKAAPGAADLGGATLLTPGDFEVEHVAPSPDGRSIVFSSNQNDIDRRHLWRVPVDGSERPAALTAGEGIEWSPAIGGDGVVWLLRSDTRRPARPAVLPAAGAPRDVEGAAPPATFPASSLVTPRAVRLTAPDGLVTHGQLFLPPDLRPGEKRPAVVFLHGGSRRQMLLGWHYMYYYHVTYAYNQYLASLGYIVLSANYRSGIGYGLEFREAFDYGVTGASEYNDVLAAAEFLRARDDVDPARIGLWGGSYGGYLTALGLARDSDLFAAGVDLHGVHDRTFSVRGRIPGWDVMEERRAVETAWKSSPMADVERWRSPVLLIHGDDDRNVDFLQTLHLAEELERRGVDTELLIFPDEVHDFLVHRHWLEALGRATAFFGRTLRRPAAVKAR